MLKVGDPAPDFSATTTEGRTLRLSELRGRKVVLYFFPKAFTPGCTLETRRFRDAYEDLRSLGAEVIGVSGDSHERQCAFAAAQGVTFPLVGDSDHAIAKSYDVLWPLFSLARRVTYVIDEDGRIEAVFHHELDVGRHIKDVRAHLQARAQKATPP
ncbi:MAG: peroxiredoxin [Myxococcota bacterium]|nr:peroxiredoxin [Myxococcota bacterium]